jgi:hypothetical protein
MPVAGEFPITRAYRDLTEYAPLRGGGKSNMPMKRNWIAYHYVRDWSPECTPHRGSPSAKGA